MSLKNVDIDSALRRMADRRIEEAMLEGKFENLEGMGKPLNLEPMPADENARLTWWALRIMKTNDVVPDEVQWRKQLDLMREKLVDAPDLQTLARQITEVNALAKKINTLGTNAIATPAVGVDRDEALAAWNRARKMDEIS